MLSIVTLIKGKMTSSPTVTTANGAITAPVAAPAPFPTTAPITAVPTEQPKPRVPFGGKGHVLTDEDRRKGAEARKAKAAAAKAEKAAQREADKAAKQAERDAAKSARDEARATYFTSDLHGAFNYLTGRPTDASFFQLGMEQCDTAALAGRLALDLPGLRFLKTTKGDWEVVLKHRKTGSVLILVAQGRALFFASEYMQPGDVPASLGTDLALIATRAGIAVA